MNILLDTNSFRYLYQKYHDIQVPIKIENKKFDSDSYISFCSSCANIYISSEALFELMFQDMKTNNSIDEFCKQYQFINEFKRENKLNFKVMNSVKDIYFDSYYLAKCVNNKIPIDIGKYINKRIKYEMKIMFYFIQSAYTVAKDVVLAATGDRIYTDDFNYLQEQVYKKMECSVERLYKEYYVNYSITMKQFENSINNILGSMLFVIFNVINEHTRLINPKLIIDSELNSKFVSGTIDNLQVDGTRYVKEVFEKLNKRLKSKKQFSKEFNDYVKLLQSKYNQSEIATKYITFLSEQFINGRKIKKNDVLDYSIVTSLDKNSILIDSENIAKKNEIVLVTFDKTVRNFCEKNKWLYDHSVYEKFLIDD